MLYIVLKIRLLSLLLGDVKILRQSIPKNDLLILIGNFFLFFAFWNGPPKSSATSCFVRSPKVFCLFDLVLTYVLGSYLIAGIVHRDELDLIPLNEYEATKCR